MLKPGIAFLIKKIIEDKMKKLSMISISTVLFVFFLIGCNTNTDIVSPDSQMNKSYTGEFNSPDGVVYPITQEEIDGLIHMRIEEKLARDVYTVMGSTYNSKVFLNIKLSEQSHMNAVKRQLDKYSIPDPLLTDEVGIFPDQEFQALYDQLIAQGNLSLTDALLAGKAIEELDIADLEAQLAFITNPGIINLYTNLKAGSISHLAAFERNLQGCSPLAVN